jgi:hypothetical protein
MIPSFSASSLLRVSSHGSQFNGRKSRVAFGEGSQPPEQKPGSQLPEDARRLIEQHVQARVQNGADTVTNNPNVPNLPLPEEE